MMKRCIEDDPGFAGIETWMRSLGDGWETVLVAQQKAMFPYLCVRWPWADRYLRECSCAPVLTMGQALLMRLCWQRDDAGQHWCHR
jgi:hypothetical protein